MSMNRSEPAFSVSTTDRNLTAHAGADLLRATAHAVGLGVAIATHLRLKKRARGLSEAESILAMAEAVALGATCLDDLAVARADHAQKELRGFAVPAPQTAGSFLKRFTLGHIRQLDKALRAVHLRAFQLLGVKVGNGRGPSSSRRPGATRSHGHCSRRSTVPDPLLTASIACASMPGSCIGRQSKSNLSLVAPVRSCGLDSYLGWDRGRQACVRAR